MPDETLLIDALEDLANNRDITVYHQQFEATINLSDSKGLHLLTALHESGFQVINETDEIYTLRYSSENGLKPKPRDWLIEETTKAD